MKKIKNNTESTKTWLGQQVAAGEYYTLQAHEEQSWAHNDAVLVDIANDEALVNNGEADIPAVADAIDFLKGSEVRLDELKDIDGNLLIRPKAAKAGWVFGMIPIEITTAKLNCYTAQLVDGTTRSGITAKIYDEDDVEITTQEGEVNAVKTIIDFEPTFDYEIIGGQLQQKTKPTTTVRTWVIAVPDIAAPTGSKEMIGGVNLEFLDPADKVNADGRVSKYMAYNATYHTNKLRFVFKHNAGVQHDVLIVLDLFRA